MAKNLKLTIKNTQIAEAINLGKLKNKIAKSQAPSESEEALAKMTAAKTPKAEIPESSKAAAQPATPAKEETAAPRIRARSRSAFGEGSDGKSKTTIPPTQAENDEDVTTPHEAEEIPKHKTSEELRKEIFAEELEELSDKTAKMEFSKSEHLDSITSKTKGVIPQKEDHLPEAPKPVVKETVHPTEKTTLVHQDKKPLHQKQFHEPTRQETPRHETARPAAQEPPKQEFRALSANRLGPTGRHVNDLLPKKAPPRPPVSSQPNHGNKERPRQQPTATTAAADTKPKFKTEVKAEDDKKIPGTKAKEFKDVKAPRRNDSNTKSFDARDRLGLRTDDDNAQWRKRRHKQAKHVQEDTTIRPTTLKIRTPISIKDLASEMKLKSSQLISKLFMQGLVATLNDMLDDETTIQLLGHEFGCEITIDTTEEERIRITDKTVAEEIKDYPEESLKMRAPIVAFMGHVDHGKTSLIDAIRSSNRAAGEAGAITQHIGAFKCSTRVGDICILDTPGHEAFSAMRARGADVTDIVVLVVAGDEGMRQQTIEALNHALEAKVTIVVAINKSDKPNFDPETIYRQLSENNLLPEAWGGQTITVNCSAVTRDGIDALLEMLALQAEVMELKANPEMRARGRVIESEMHKGMGAVATVLVQNGTLKLGDCLVFDQYWGRVKTMQDDKGKNVPVANPSTPVSITGLSGLPEAGQEFIVVKNEKEAREIAQVRMTGMRQNSMLKKRLSMENLMLAASEPTKKILNIILRADVQGSLEALKVGLMKILSKKAEVNIISAGVGEVSESDVQLASTSKATIIGFHTQIESHAEALIRQLGVQVKMHDIIYHAIDDVTLLLVDLLDKIAIETDKGKFTVKAVFKSSHYGLIAGGVVSDGSIQRNNHVRIKRNNEIIGKSSISSLKRVKEDVREVQKGLECGIVLSSFTTPLEGDVYESYEVTYITQEL